MKDSKTGERVVVQKDETYGPYVRVSNYEDADALEDILDEKYFVLFWMRNLPELEESGGKVYFFGGAADPVKLQAILDQIQLHLD